MWPEQVSLQFIIVPINAPNSDYVGPYHKLLPTLFPVDSYFTIATSFQYLPNTDKRIAMFEISFLGRPVLCVQLQDSSILDVPSERQAANDLFRSRVLELAGRCPLKTLHAVSAFDRELYFYSVSDGKNRLDELKEGIASLSFARDPPDVNDGNASESHKAYDVLGSDGEERLRQTMADIVAECALFDARFRERASGVYDAKGLNDIVDSVFSQ